MVTLRDEVIVAARPTPITRDWELLLRRGIDALERERFDEAAATLRQAAALNTQSQEIFLALGIVYTRLLRIPQAEAALERAIALDPAAFYPHLRLAELYLRIGVPTEAKTQLDLAMDASETPEQRQMVRELIAIERRRSHKRAWRPDFSLFSKKPKNRSQP